MPRLTCIVLTQDVRTADRVSMCSKPASRTNVASSLGFVTLHAGGSVWQAARAGLRGVSFRAEGDSHSCCFGFVGDIGPLTSMRPQAYLLLALGIEPLAIGHIPYIADHQCADLALFGPVHDGAADLVFQIAGATFLPGKKAHLPPEQPFPTPRAFVLPSLLRLYFRQAFCAVLLIGSQRPAGDDDRFLPIGEGRRMNLPQVDRGDVISRRRGAGFVPSSTTRCQL